MYSSPALMSASTSVRRERNHRPRGQRGRQRHDRRDQEQALARAGRDDDFLEQQLHPVGDRLQQAERPDAVRADAHLHLADHLALGAASGRRRRSSAAARWPTILTIVHTGSHARAQQAALPGCEQLVHAVHARSTVTAPDMPSRPQVDGCAAAMRTTPGGTAGSTWRRSTRFTARPGCTLTCAPSAIPSSSSSAADACRAFGARASRRLLQRRRAAHQRDRQNRSARRRRARRRRRPSPAAAITVRVALVSVACDVAVLPPALRRAPLRDVSKSKPGSFSSVAQHAQHLPCRARVAQRLDRRR